MDESLGWHKSASEDDICTYVKLDLLTAWLRYSTPQQLVVKAATKWHLQVDVIVWLLCSKVLGYSSYSD